MSFNRASAIKAEEIKKVLQDLVAKGNIKEAKKQFIALKHLLNSQDDINALNKFYRDIMTAAGHGSLFSSVHHRGRPHKPSEEKASVYLGDWEHPDFDLFLAAPSVPMETDDDKKTEAKVESNMQTATPRAAKSQVKMSRKSSLPTPSLAGDITDRDYRGASKKT